MPDFNKDGKEDFSQITGFIGSVVSKAKQKLPEFDVDVSSVQQKFSEFTAPKQIDITPLRQSFESFQSKRQPFDVTRLYRENVEVPAKQFGTDFKNNFLDLVRKKNPISNENYQGSKLQSSIVGTTNALDRVNNSILGAPGRYITGDFGKETTPLQSMVTRPAAEIALSVSDFFGGPKTLNTKGDKFAEPFFGKDHLKSYQEQAKTGGKDFLMSVGFDEKTAMKLVPIMAVTGIALDITPPGLDDIGKSGAKKLTKNVAESAGEKAAKELIEEVGEKAIKDPDVQKRLWSLLNYEDVLRKAGYTSEQLKGISSKKGLEIIEKRFPQMIPDFKGAVKPFEYAFSDWVNGRRSAELVAIAKKKGFESLDEQGIQAIYKIQQGKLPEVRKYFDDIYTELRGLGADFGYKQNYLPQMWRNSKEEVEQTFKALGKNAPFTKESVFKNYREGVNAGLVPRFEKVSDLIGWYQRSAEKMKADRNFLDYLEAKNLIGAGKDAEPGWIRITAQGFPTKKIKEGTETVEHFYSAPPEVAKMINNYLNGATVESIEKIADYASGVKNIKLAGGIPNTGVNAHGWNILVRSTLSRNNPIGGLWDAGRWILNPNSADKFVQKSLPKAAEYSKYGLTLTTEGFSFTPDPKIIDGNVIQKSYKVLGNAFDKYMGDPLFRKVIPALKIKLMDEVTQGLIKSGIDEDKALREGAKVVNNMMGGINVDELARNKDFQNVLRAVVLAPDWAESTIRTGGGIAKGLYKWRDPLTKQYRVFARNLMFSLIAKMGIEYALNGEANSEGLFNLDTGTYTGDGKKRVFRAFGTGADMARIPFETAQSILQGKMDAVGKIVTNRLSLPASTALHFVTNENYYGQPLWGKDKYGNQIPLSQQISGTASELSNVLGIPNQIGVGLNLATGAISPEEALVQGVEGPLRYYGGPSQYESSKKKYETYKSAGLQGEELYSAMEYKPKDEGNFITKLFNKQKSGDTIPTDPILKELYLDEKSDERKKRIKEIFSMGLTPTQIQKVLIDEKLGNYEDASLVVIKDLGVESGARGRAIQTIIQGLSGDELVEKLRYLSDQKVLTTAVLTQYEDAGILTETEVDWIKSKIKKTSSSSKKKIKIPKVSLPAIPGGRISAKAVKAPNVPKLNSVKLSGINAPEVKWQQIESELRKIVNAN